MYLHINQNTQEAPKWGPKGAPVGPGTEVTGGGAAIKKTLENVTFGGLSGVGQTGDPGSLWSKFRGVHFGAVLGGPLGPFWDPSGDHFEGLGPAFWIPCGVLFWGHLWTIHVKALSVVPVLLAVIPAGFLCSGSDPRL